MSKTAEKIEIERERDREKKKEREGGSEQDRSV